MPTYSEEILKQNVLLKVLKNKEREHEHEEEGLKLNLNNQQDNQQIDNNHFEVHKLETREGKVENKNNSLDDDFFSNVNTNQQQNNNTKSNNNTNDLLDLL